MAPTPVTHPLEHRPTLAAEVRLAHRRRAMRLHPTAAAATPAAPSTTPAATSAVTIATAQAPDLQAAREDGSMTTEYGLLVVVGATITSLVIRWASGGAIFELLGGVLDAARSLVGA